MKFTLILLLSLASTQLFAQQFYRELIQKPEHAAKYSDYFGQACFDDLKTFYKAGKLLKSPHMQALMKPISELAARNSDFERIRTNITKTPAGYYTFYHYTKATNLLTSFDSSNSDRDAVHEKSKAAAYSEMMSFLKVPSSSGVTLFSVPYYRISKGFVYISSCPTCSTSYGSIQLSFTLSPLAKWLDVTAGGFSWSTVQNEASSLYPEIFRSCSFDKIGGFFAEDSGVDVVDYTSSGWYQLTNFYRVVNSDSIIASGDSETIERARARKYSMNPVWGPGKSSATPARPAAARPAAVVAPKVKADPAIEIVEASWGLKNNILKNTKAFCDTKLTCDYKIHEKYLPGLTYDAAKPQPFTVKWKCDGVTIKSQTIPGDAHDKVVTIACQ